MSSKVDQRWHNVTATGRRGSRTPLPIPRVCVTFCHSPEKESLFFDSAKNQVVDAIYLVRQVVLSDIFLGKVLKVDFKSVIKYSEDSQVVRLQTFIENFMRVTIFY